MHSLVEKMLSGDRLSLSRLMSRVESRSSDHMQVMENVVAHALNHGHAEVIGITGPPGAGKSTTVDKLISHLRKQGKKVGVVAIDPSSPFSGGAVLGDRIRMQDHAGDDDVFIRSLGSRGNQGGLSRATRDIVKLYDAFGMDAIIVETVGVGQTELDIMEIADTTVVLLTPESGDAIQTMKAGILEIADIFVVNKADRDGSMIMQMELKAMLEFGERLSQWVPPVLLVQADKDKGIDELLISIQNHQSFLEKNEDPQISEKKQKALMNEVGDIVLEELRERLKNTIREKSLENQNPYQIASEVLKKVVSSDR